MSRAKLLALVATGLFTLAGPAPASAAQQPPPRDFDVVGYFTSPDYCQWAGQSGRADHHWASYDCDRSRGSYRGLWQLNVRSYGPTGDHGHSTGHNGQMPHHPGWPPRGPWPR